MSRSTRCAFWLIWAGTPPRAPAWVAYTDRSSCVIPAPLDRAADERESAGTHAPQSKLSVRVSRPCATREADVCQTKKCAARILIPGHECGSMESSNDTGKRAFWIKIFVLRCVGRLRRAGREVHRRK